jgi:general stress protein 26
MKIIRDRPHSFELDQFLERPLFCHLATDSAEGPRNSPLWFLWEDGAIWIIGNETTDTFPERIRNQSRCAISFIDFDKRTGRVEHVGMRGRASIQPFAQERARKLLKRYLGEQEPAWDMRFQRALEEPTSLLVRFEPETVVIRDVSYEPAA